MPSLTTRFSDTHSPTEFFYHDSGAPDRDVYTTVVILHGISFHSAAFQHVMPLAASKGLRMVCLNRRHYPGTTLYTPAELKVAAEGDADEHAAFFKTRGVELAFFLHGLIDALSLPGPTPDGKDGGLALMGWSMGNQFTLSTIASVSSLQPQVQARLQSYLRKLIIFDPPAQGLGIPGPPAPSPDPTMTPQEVWTGFAQWISCYFTHGDLTTHDVRNIEFLNPNLNKISVLATLSPEKLSSILDYQGASLADIFLFRSQTVLFDQMQKALFDPETRSLWPKLDIWLLHCDSSAGMMILAALEIEKLVKANENLPVHISTIEDAHHLVFWDEPEKFMGALDHCLRE